MNNLPAPIKILFISHDASRTGAPILLLHFITAFKKRNPEIITDIIIARDGPLTASFAPAGRVLILGEKKTNWFGELIAKMKRRLRVTPSFFTDHDKEGIRKFVSTQDYKTIFSNTILNGLILDIIKPNKEKVVSYIHELEGLIRSFTTPASLSCIFKYTGHFCVPSEAVSKNLLAHFPVDRQHISLLKYFIPEVEVEAEKKTAIRSKLKISADTLVIGGVGTGERRKGIDLFLQTAIQFKKKYNSPFIFLWVGVGKDALLEQGILQDAEKAEMSDHLIFEGPVSNPADYIAMMDIFLLSSREDAYPLVVLEAAMQEKPLLCFDQSGGAAAFIQESGNTVVPYLDIQTMTNQLLKLVEAEDRRIPGRDAKAYCRQLHAEEVTLPPFEKMLGIHVTE